MSLLDNIFINLKIIAKIPENGRIGTTSAGQVYLEQDKYKTTAIRTLTGDSRDKTVLFLMGLINDITQISDNIISSLYISRNYEKENANNTITLSQLNENARKSHQLAKLVRELKNSKRGISNLYTTYRKDPTITAKLEEVIDKIDLQVEKIDNALHIIDTSDEQTIEHLRTRARIQQPPPSLAAPLTSPSTMASQPSMIASPSSIASPASVASHHQSYVYSVLTPPQNDSDDD